MNQEAATTQARPKRTEKPRTPRMSFLLSEDRLFQLLAIVIGVLAGLLVVCFRVAIDWVRLTLRGSSLAPPFPRVVLIPALGGIAVAVLVKHVFPRVRGSGLNQTKAALFIYDGYIPFSTVTGKFITCALALGSGQSLGPEDPSLQIGAGIASTLGRRLRLSREKMRLIAPIGAAAGLGAAFNAPIASVLLVIEEVIGGWSAGVLGAIVLSSVSSVVVVRWFLGDAPMFRVPPYHLVHPQELLAYATLGVLGGVASLAFIKLIAHARPRLKALPRWTQYVQPAVAGLIVGAIGIWVPQVMGVGYEFIDQALHGQFTWQLLLLLATLKIVTTSVSFTSGVPGGLFAPTLFVGAMMGGAVGGLARAAQLAPVDTTGSFALVGMGTLFAGFVRAPMTSVFMVLELSGSYSIILPVMISNTIAYLISRRFQQTPIFDALTRQDGLDLPSMEEQREERVWRVEDAMRSETPPVVGAQEPIGEIAARIAGLREPWLVVRIGHGFGAVSREAVMSAHNDGQDAVALTRALKVSRLPRVHPDQPLELALRLLTAGEPIAMPAGAATGELQGIRPFLPVVHRADFSRLEGVVSLHDILKAYRARAEERVREA